MMVLRTSPASPFGRKCVIAASVLGLSDSLQIDNCDTMNLKDPIRQQNPVGKIPLLITDDGSFYDSRVILEYLDHKAGGGKIIPKEPKARFEALRLQAMCDGILDASLLQVYEARWRPADRHDAKWLEHQAGKVERGMRTLENAPPPVDAIPTVGQIATACVLGYRDLRFAGKWRQSHPRLVSWLEQFASKVPAFAATKIAA